MVPCIMDVAEAKKKFEGLYEGIDGYGLSKTAQAKLSYYYNAHIYGEIDFDSFRSILTKTNPKQNEIFYDLGSGTGKAVILAALCFPFSKCIGVEKLDELYESSVETAKKAKLPNVEFIHADFNHADFSDGDVIYLNSYYFRYEMANSRFKKYFYALKPGTRLIFVQTPLDDPELEIIHEGDCEFSWGMSTVFISRKL